MAERSSPRTEGLDKFRDKMIDYLEGESDEKPSLEELTDVDQRKAEWWLDSLAACRGVNPEYTRPSTEELLKKANRCLDDRPVLGSEGDPSW